MRDLILLAILLPASLAALRRPWIGAVAWAWVSIMNPHRLAYGFAHDFPWAQMIFACTFIGLFVSPDRKRMVWYAPVVAMLLFTVWQSLAYPTSFHVEASYEMWTRVLKINLMILLTIALIQTRTQTQWLVATLAASLAFYGTKGGLFTLAHAGSYRVQGPQNSFIGGNNELALALCMVIPLVYYLYDLAEKRWQKWALMGAMLLCALSAIGSHSRGALLALFAMGGVLWWRSKSKFGLGLAIVMVVGLVFTIMPAEWFERMNTIKTYNQDASAMGRINAWIVAWNVAKEHVFGGGYQIWNLAVFTKYAAPNPTDVHVAHSIYFQVMGEQGFMGLFLFLLMWFFTWRLAGWPRRAKEIKADERFDWARKLGSAIQVSLVGYLVGGAFLSLAYFDLPYYLLALAAIMRKIIVAELAEAPQPATLAAAQPLPANVIALRSPA